MRDFNQILEQTIEETARKKLKCPLMIFTFSDPDEIHKAYLNRLFSKKITQIYAQEQWVQTLKINPPTDKEIEKVLFSIINKEGANNNNIALNKFQIEDIKQKANRDLRSAIQLLQFYSAGRLDC